MARNWYAYTGSPGFENVIGNYILAEFKTGYCRGGANTCQIYARANGNQPLLISENLRRYIVASKASGTYFPIGENIVAYVYNRA